METVEFWWWFGFAFLMISIVAISALDFLLWLGMAGIILGVLTMIWPDMGWKLQFALFSLASVVLLLLWWKFWRNPVSSDKPYLNQRGAQYIGRVFTLEKPIVNGYGKVHVDDTMWKVTGADRAAGEKVKIVGVNGVVLVAANPEELGSKPGI